MDELIGGLSCGAFVLGVPVAVVAGLAFSATRALRKDVERLSNQVSGLQAMAVPGLFGAGDKRAAAAPAPSAPLPAAVAAPLAAESAPAAAVGSPAVETAPAAAVTPAAPAAARTAAAPSGSAGRPPAPPPVPPAPLFELGAFIEKGAVWAFAALGGLLLVIAALFGLREAIAAGLLGPVARFGFGVGAGLGAWFLAEVLAWRKYPAPAAALSGAGAAILYATLYAGHGRWGIINQGVTFATMCGVTLVGVLLAERRSSRFIAYLAMLGGYATPILLSTGENKPVAFFSYLGLVNLGLLVVAVRRRWPDLVGITAGVTVMLYVGWMWTYRAPDQVLVGFAAALAFALMWTVTARRAGEGTRAKVIAVFGVGAAVAFWLVAAMGLGTPTDPLNIDPVSHLRLDWALGPTAWFGAAWLVGGAVLVPLLLRGHLVGRLISGVAVGVAMLTFAASWTLAGEGRWDVVVVVLPSCIAAAFLTAGLEAGLGVLGFVGLSLLVTAPIQTVPAGLLPWLTMGIAAAVVVGALRTRSRAPLAALAVVGALPLYGGLSERVPAGEGGSLALATLPLYLLGAVGPFVIARRGDVWGALTGVLTPLTLAWPLYVVWQQAMGDGVDGLLPLVLGANALLAALVLVRGAKSNLGEKEVVLLIALTLLAVALAVPMQLERTWLTVGWAILIVLLAWVNRRIPHPLFVGFATLLSLLVAMRLLVNPHALQYGYAEGAFLVNWTLYTWGIPTVALLLAARWFPQTWLKVGQRSAAILTGFALVNVEIAHAFAHDGELSFRSERLGEEMVRSLSWGGYGLMLIVVGIRRRRRAVRLSGLMFTVLGVGKVFVVDLWSLSGFARVGAFGGMAVTLLAAAVAFAWLARNDQPAPPQQEPPR
ncbi:MAG: DUF2339 domain-containing protein [Myxococcales bacterium]|nr:DUF2339 domain-containing protein [Myxococcales bacterium]